MKKTLLLISFLIFGSGSFAQNNPVENLTWGQDYENMQNFFELRWEEPAQPHGELLGYNVYRNDELFRFQTETTVYRLYVDLYGIVSNTDEMFLGLDNQGQPFLNGIDLYVTAVYGADQIESDHLQTYHSEGLLLKTKNFTQEKAVLFPNPTNGILNIGNENLEKIAIYDLSGKVVNEFAPQSQIDLGHLSSGLYIIKLFSERGTLVDKIVID
jgi:hypothetical protein